MKTFRRYIDAIRSDIEYWVGDNECENFDIIDRAKPIDLWFHVDRRSSCHVIAVLPEENKYDKKQLHKIAIQGSVLCKQFSRYKAEKNLAIMYTSIERVNKTEKVGAVQVDSYKIITI
jgi:predicted ribosome quality control (RQC) complex YloA/Tae2 family protein